MYEQATMGQRAIKIPLMEAVRREAALISHERNMRLDELRSLLAKTPATAANFRQRAAWREEQLQLLKNL